MIVIVAIGNMAVSLAGIWYWVKLPPYQLPKRAGIAF